MGCGAGHCDTAALQGGIGSEDLLGDGGSEVRPKEGSEHSTQDELAARGLADGSGPAQGVGLRLHHVEVVEEAESWPEDRDVVHPAGGQLGEQGVVQPAAGGSAERQERHLAQG